MQDAKQKVSAKVLFPDLSYKITGFLFMAHTQLGRYAREKQYGDFLEKELKKENILFKREIAVADSGNVADFIIDEKILIELKAARTMSKDCYRQIQNYLQQTKIKLGILVNFREFKLMPKRILRIDAALIRMSDNS